MLACFTFYCSRSKPFELSCCANKNTNTLIINALVSESRASYDERVRGNVRKSIIYKVLDYV